MKRKTAIRILKDYNLFRRYKTTETEISVLISIAEMCERVGVCNFRHEVDLMPNFILCSYAGLTLRLDMSCVFHRTTSVYLQLRIPNSTDPISDIGVFDVDKGEVSLRNWNFSGLLRTLSGRY